MVVVEAGQLQLKVTLDRTEELEHYSNVIFMEKLPIFFFEMHSNNTMEFCYTTDKISKAAKRIKIIAVQ